MKPPQYQPWLRSDGQPQPLCYLLSDTWLAAFSKVIMSVSDAKRQRRILLSFADNRRRLISFIAAGLRDSNTIGCFQVGQQRDLRQNFWNTIPLRQQILINRVYLKGFRVKQVRNSSFKDSRRGNGIFKICVKYGHFCTQMKHQWRHFAQNQTVPTEGFA